VAVILAVHAVVAGAWGQGSVPSQPTLAVFPLEAATGVEPGTARVLTDYLVDEVRRTKVFSRVVSAQEIESLIGFERQRQLLDCTERSCLAEIAGTLGVDMVLGGSVAKLGGTYLGNLRVTETGTALTRASVTMRVKGESPEALLDAVRPAVEQLLAEAGLGAVKAPPVTAVPPVVAQAPVKQTAPAPAVPASQPQGEGGKEVGGPSLRVPLVGAGGAGLAVAVLGGFVALLPTTAALASQALWRMGVFTPFLAGVLYEDRLRLFYGSSALALGVTGAGVLLSLLLAAVGLGAVAGGMVLG
jgi:hypothetical protein